jgi:hypothetical protein
MDECGFQESNFLEGDKSKRKKRKNLTLKEQLCLKKNSENHVTSWFIESGVGFCSSINDFSLLQFVVGKTVKMKTV